MSKLTRVQLSIAAAEAALKDIIAEGKKPSQYAVEMRAGLTNGALNYKCEEYIEFKQRLLKLKETKSEANDLYKTWKAEYKKQAALKDKYRAERDFLKEENKKLHGHNKELLYQLFLMQQEMIQIKETNIIDFNAIKFNRESE